MILQGKVLTIHLLTQLQLYTGCFSAILLPKQNHVKANPCLMKTLLFVSLKASIKKLVKIKQLSSKFNGPCGGKVNPWL